MKLEIREATVVLVGRIGAPVDRPAELFADIKCAGCASRGIRQKASDILNTAIAEGPVFDPYATAATATKGSRHVAAASV
ncbi:MAG TPA: hypothetical protein VJ750_00550 [Rhizomicrobium sp.]|nr:hypothetical protein [Rhizomicrobium sp.]